jgi:hypothetical protein
LDRKPAVLALLFAVIILVGAGCSGINTTQSVSPATFLLPGFFGQTTAPAAVPSAAPPAAESVQTLARAN